MKRVPVGFWDAESILKFIKIISGYEDDLDLICGSYSVDAKSLLAVFSMKTAGHMELLIHGESYEKLLKDIDSYIEYAEMGRRRNAFV